MSLKDYALNYTTTLTPIVANILNTVIATTATPTTVNLITTAATAAGTGALVFASTTGVFVGMAVTGTNIPSNTTVSTVTATQITLSNPTTASGVALGATVVFTEIILLPLPANFKLQLNEVLALDAYTAVVRISLNYYVNGVSTPITMPSTFPALLASLLSGSGYTFTFTELYNDSINYIMSFNLVLSTPLTIQ